MAYNPNYYMPQPMTAPMVIPSAQPNYYPQSANAQPVNGLIPVTGFEGAKAYQLPPNSSVALFDKENDIFYIKTTDAGGYPTIREYEFRPIQREQEQRTEYVPRSEFDALVAKVAELTQGADDGK